MNTADKQQKRNRRLILLVMIMSFIPFLIAWVFTKNPDWLSSERSNLGQLIVPPVTTQRTEFSGYDQFSIDNLTELNGHWVMINIIPGKQCTKECSVAIESTRKIRLMMNKDLTRIRRVVLIFEQINPQQVGVWWQKDTRLLRAKPSAPLMAKIKAMVPGVIPEGMLLLMDPFGNLMMSYESGFDPYAVKTDLKKLLRISQIG